MDDRPRYANSIAQRTICFPHFSAPKGRRGADPAPPESRRREGSLGRACSGICEGESERSGRSRGLVSGSTNEPLRMWFWGLHARGKRTRPKRCPRGKSSGPPATAALCHLAMDREGQAPGPSITNRRATCALQRVESKYNSYAILL